MLPALRNDITRLPVIKGDYIEFGVQSRRQELAT